MPLKESTATFVFDDWKALAETNPQAFEQKRQSFIDSIISEAPSKHHGRLRGLQWRIDAERQRSSNPLSSCVRISRMMLDSVYGEAGLVSALNGNVQRDSSAAATVVGLTDVRRAKQGE